MTELKKSCESRSGFWPGPQFQLTCSQHRSNLHFLVSLQLVVCLYYHNQLKSSLCVNASGQPLATF